MRVHVYYDAQLIRILSDNGNGNALLVEYGGQEIILPADPVHASQMHKALQSGVFSKPTGAARLIARRADGTPIRYYFEIYPDQTLKRAPELDVFEYSPEKYNANCIGWRNALNPAGFLAPKGIIPGEQGNFISDSAESFEVDVPYEFTDLCTRLRCDPVIVLRDFVAHACRLKNTASLPRGDGLTSQGEAAEELIARYLEQVYGKPER